MSGAPHTSSGLKPKLMGIARKGRSFLYQAISPFDRIFLKFNRLSLYPPIHLRRHVSLLGSGLNGPSYEFVVYLRLLAGLKNGDAMWDLGCGCGLLELALADLGWKGRLVGTDIHGPGIRWSQRKLAPKFKQHSFEHMDIYNEAYWPKGRLSAGQWLEQFTQKDFDVVIAKSLFTHMLPDELALYFRGIAARLKPGGRAMLTFFLLDDEQAKASAGGRARLTFEPYAEDNRCSVMRQIAPTASVAYPVEYVLKQLVEAGFNAERCKVYPGAWSGRPDGLSHQDIIVVER